MHPEFIQYAKLVVLFRSMPEGVSTSFRQLSGINPVGADGGTFTKLFTVHFRYGVQRIAERLRRRVSP